MARSWLDSARLRGLIVYCVYRPNRQDVLATHIDMQGENRPDVVSMVDVESWGGEIEGDNSDAVNRLVWGIGEWRGPRIDGRPRRVIGYLNPHDASIWAVRPPIGFVIPSYGSLPSFPHLELAVRSAMTCTGCSGHRLHTHLLVETAVRHPPRPRHTTDSRRWSVDGREAFRWQVLYFIVAAPLLARGNSNWVDPQRECPARRVEPCDPGQQQSV